MSEKEFETALATLKMYQKRSDMIAEILDERERLKNVSSGSEITRGVASAILYQAGFVEESAELLQTPKADEKGIPDLYELADPSEIQAPDPLFRGVPMLDPLFRPKELPPPTPAQIRDAIEDIEDLTDYVMKNIDAMLCTAKLELPPAIHAKFAAVVRAIELY